MSANAGLRLVCADILQALALADMWRFVSLDDRRPLGLLEGAGLLRWAERWQYGDPVPADVHQATLDELEDLREARDVAASLREEIDELKATVQFYRETNG